MLRKTALVTAIAFSATLIFSACASKPSAEELRQLNDLKAEVASLEKQIADKEKEKAKLEQDIAEKNGKLQQCQEDQVAVKKVLGQ